jgi:hypothetical protein
MHAFTREFTNAGSANQFVDREREIRQILIDHLPKVPNATCPVCDGEYVQAAPFDVYCCGCFFRVSTCPHCFGSEMDLSTATCKSVGCGRTAHIPDRMDMDAKDVLNRERVYAGALDQVRGRDGATDGEGAQFYVMVNKLAGMFALLDDTVLPGEVQRTKAFVMIQQIKALLK